MSGEIGQEQFPPLLKFPRTPHLEGSGLQAGDEDLATVDWRELRGVPLVVTEKLDGSNCALRFTRDGRPLLQSRGHYLTGGTREGHFALLKQWASTYAAELFAALGSRYMLYGEWLYGKHTIFYDALPHYLIPFDVYDLERAAFVDTAKRRAILSPLAQRLRLPEAPVVYEGVLRGQNAVGELIAGSRFITPGFLDRLDEQADRLKLDRQRLRDETDLSGRMEGLYLRHEADGVVQARYKFVRRDFLQRSLESGAHWADRPVVPNGLADDVSLFD